MALELAAVSAPCGATLTVGAMVADAAMMSVPTALSAIAGAMVALEPTPKLMLKSVAGGVAS